MSRVMNLPTALVSMWLIFPATSAAISFVVGGPSVFKLLPFLCLLSLIQDFLRYMFLGAKKPALAFTADLVWFVTGVVGFAASLAFQENGLFCLIGTQILGASVASIILFRGRNRLSSVRVIKTARVGSLLTEAATISTLPQISQFVIASIIGVSAVGEYRSAQLLMVPVTMIASQAQAIVFPRLIPEDRKSIHKWALLCGGTAGILGIIILAARWLDPFGIFDFFGFADGSSYYWTVAFIGTAAALGLYLMIYMVRIRIVVPGSFWLRWRIGIAALEPVVSVGVGVMAGAPGLALGSVASNVTALAAMGARDYRVTKEDSGIGIDT
ncbi:hypothetical protein ACRAJ3_15350 [Rhodococcus pyridinivorans]|uniref:hypothetical protein n=1 Tax=Rhodococcus pyridinivorans TaxID=103816 RepID=UPI003D7FAE44